jgi:hypothetical protein
MASNNSSNLAQSLADTAGQYAYQNYAAMSVAIKLTL